MKKKGFTLIELLAVIVILAIIALIATPLVLKYIEKSRRESKVDSAYSFVRNLETEIANFSIKNNGEKYTTDKENIKELGLDITVKGENPEDGKVCISSVGQIEKGVFQYGKYYVSYDGKKGSIIDEATYTSFSCSGNGGANSFESIYNYGDEVTFNPGDGDRTWNVIGEDKENVTLILTENLGKDNKWYSSANNNYGPEDVLNYLSDLTIDWDKVDPIVSYSYENNSNGTVKPNGYQKIEITNGVVTLTHNDGTTKTLDKINRARILSLEEVFEISSKTNPNLEEENLKLYIERNLDDINTKLGTSATTSDEVVENYVQKSMWAQKESEHLQLYFTVKTLAQMHKIESTYDMLLPGYLYQKLNSSTGPFGYWLFSTYANSSSFAREVNYHGIVEHYGVGYSRGVRPVITIPKSKL